MEKLFEYMTFSGLHLLVVEIYLEALFLAQ